MMSKREMMSIMRKIYSEEEEEEMRDMYSDVDEFKLVLWLDYCANFMIDGPNSSNIWI